MRTLPSSGVESIIPIPAFVPTLGDFLLEEPLEIGLEVTEETIVKGLTWRDAEKVVVEGIDECRQVLVSFERLVFLGEAYTGKGQ